MELKYIFANIILISILYYAFKLFDRKYTYCKRYTFGYIIGFMFVYLMPMVIFDIGYFVDVSWKLILFSFYMASLSGVFFWYGFRAYNKERLEKEGIVSNNFLAQNPKIFTIICFMPIVMCNVLIILILLR